ncbi:hypothetical protein FRB90_011906 [Tulasnella sp. 427]|nr:hypothetical protein FRB90_011906 [Tulasnella sp. 427]
MSASAPPLRKAIHGRGQATLEAFGRGAVFSDLSFTYPLKLISPQISGPSPVAIAYVLSYGGGLISGDQIDLGAETRKDATLVLLTQGSTKVFPSRTIDRIRASNVFTPQTDGPNHVSQDTTRQILSAKIASGSNLILLPDPVTCFARSNYTQTQTFRLELGASLCALDWYTSGRMSRGEEWVFERYRSVNEIHVDGKRVARDVMLLEEPNGREVGPLAARTLKARMAPYSCYATLFLIGPAVAPVLAYVEQEMRSIVQFQAAAPADLIWSFSPLEHGGIVRAAGAETETVKFWLKRMLEPVQSVIGPEAFDKILI